MSNQYFENNDNLKHTTYNIDYYFKGHNIKFISDNGVFSKQKVDFGTSLLLQMIPSQERKDILDVGSGIGIIGITLGICNPTSNIDMIDVNKNAIKLASENIKINNLENVFVFESNTYEKVIKKYDMIVTNPPIRAGRKVVEDIVLNACKHLKEEGNIYLVIQDKQGAPSLIKKMKDVYKVVNVVVKKSGYFIIQAQI